MMMKNKKEKLKKEFYVFQEKVNRLEKLKHELHYLESEGLTRGFEKEVKLIKSRLKDTTATLELEKSMKNLRQKILNRKDVKKKSSLKKVGKIADVNAKLKKEIKYLKSTIKEEMNPEKQWILEAMSKGYKREDIKELLRESGWNDEKIEKIINIYNRLKGRGSL